MQKKVIAVSIAVFLLAVYAAFLVSVWPLFREVTAVMLNGQISVYGLQRYDTSRYGDEAERSARVIPLLVVHNGRIGFAYICYSYDVKNKDGMLLSSSNRILSKWDIERMGGKWNITNITERP